MGKSLIIKGADFSENGIENYDCLIGYTDDYFNLCTGHTNPGSSTPYLFSDQLSVFTQSTIKGIRIKPYSAGIIPIYVANFSSNSGSNIMSNYTFIENLNVSSDMIDSIVNIFFTNDVNLQEGQKIVFGNKDNLTMTATWYYNISGTDYPSLCLSTNAGDYWSVSTVPLFVDYIV